MADWNRQEREGGLFVLYVYHAWARTMQEGVERLGEGGGRHVVDLMRAQCPEGYHPWSVQLLRSRKGRRTSIRLAYRRNAEGAPR